MTSCADADAVALLDADLLRGPTATAALQRRCGGVPVRVEIDRDAYRQPSAQQRERLGIGEAEAVGYRRVRLIAGGVVLSHAENWFVPTRLTRAMRDLLDHSDAPFGEVIAPLGPTRRILLSERLAADTSARNAPVLRHHALVIAADGQALAEVIEIYLAAALEPGLA